MRVTARRLAAACLALACLALAACSGDAGDDGTQRAAPQRDAERAPERPPVPPPYSPPATEVSREGKRVAGRVAQALTTYGVGATPEAVARRVGSGVDVPSLAEMVKPVVLPDVRSTGDVVYPQLGGLTADAMSVMVVVRQRRESEDGSTSTETRTFDVRLRLTGGRWRFAELASIGGTPAERPSQMSPAAQAVVDSPRIDLPDSARWDIYRGEIDEALLQTMADAAERVPYSVAVLKSGHPYEVFGATHPSAHTAGYAVDIYAVDGRDVVEQRDTSSPAYRLASTLLAEGLAQIGSPWILGPGAPTSFSDAVHQDHLHVQKQQVQYQ